MKSSFSIPAVIGAAILVVAVNLGANIFLSSARIDLTQDQLFTLSPGTKKTLAEIKSPITLRLFLSERLAREAPSYAAYATRVRDMLHEFSMVSGGKLKIVDKSPAAFSEEEDEALKAGLQGVPVDAAGELVYFGLAGDNAKGETQAIPFFGPDRESFLEYDLARLVYALDEPQKIVVGVLTTLPIEGDFRASMQGLPSAPWVAIEQLRQLVDVRDLSLDAAVIPDDVTILMIIHPDKLPAKTLYALDQYFLKGGHGVIFLDPLSEVGAAAYGPAGDAMISSSDLKQLLDAWGLEMEPGKIVADGKFARRINAGTATGTKPIDYPGWISITGDAINADDSVTAKLETINMATAGSLRKKDGAAIDMVPLVLSSDQAALMPAQQFQGMPDFATLLRDFKPTGHRYVLAARVRGMVNSAFPDGPPKEEKPKDEKSKDEKTKDGAAAKPDAAKPPQPALKPHLAKSTAPLNAIIVADTDLLEDRFWVQTQEFFGRRVATPNANNGDFTINAIENLSGSDALIGLRSRGVSTRPFTRIIGLQKAAAVRLQGTEQELQKKIADLTQKLAAAQPPKPGAVPGTVPGATPGTSEDGKAADPTPEQATAIAEFQNQLLVARQDLRNVRFELRKDIRRLETWVEFVNIALMPILVALFAIGLGIVRHRRRRPVRG